MSLYKHLQGWDRAINRDIRTGDFYRRTLAQLVEAGSLDPAAPTLVVAGGTTDQEALQANDFSDVTISNLDVRTDGSEFAPYRWSFQDAQHLEFPAGSFDQVLVHAGLHHCRSPHQALLEMYRVASKSILVLEARDSSVMRAAGRLGLTPDYEVEAVVGNDMAFGGVQNTEIPNYVYRWTEREVRKTLSSYDPTGPIPLRFFHGLRLPTERLRMGRARWKRALVAALTLPVSVLHTIAPKQGNEFGFWVGKPSTPWPWIADDDPPTFNRAWAQGRYVLAPGRLLPDLLPDGPT